MIHVAENRFSTRNDFFQGNDPFALVREFGSPLYVYSEKILRERCQEVKNLVGLGNFKVHFSAKANSNRELLKIVRSEGILVDAMSPGEILVELEAGYKPQEILYIGNNVSQDEMLFAVEKGVNVSVDSVSQLEMLGRIRQGLEVVLRFNPGIGAGHHEKVVTAGKKTKFGIEDVFLPEVMEVVRKFGMKVIGINQHIGSLFLEKTPYIESVKALLQIADKFEGLRFIDFGGGFGVPYRANESRLDLAGLGRDLTCILSDWQSTHGEGVEFRVEPGRYLVAECGLLLGEVHAKKVNYGQIYIGTDLGFNVLQRPVMYNAHHEIEIYREGGESSGKRENVKIVGNICESGDIIADDRDLEEIIEGDILGVVNSGAYGYAMCSNYNNRLKPAEILITDDGSVRRIRRKETLDDLLVLYRD